MRYMQCFKNAQPVLDISLLDRAFHYGDGCFTTGRIRNNVIELEDLHLARLKLACEKLHLNVNLELINQSIEKLKLEHQTLNGTFKIVISRGEGQRGYSLPEHEADFWFYFYSKETQDFQYELIQAGVLTQSIGLLAPNLVGVKSLNRLEQVLLKKEVDEKKWAEALVTDIQGSVIEGVSSNCFVRINNTWITPELRYNGVHGIMRTEILQRMKQQGISCEQRRIDQNEIPNIQSLFFCNALSPMKIVTELNAEQLNTQACIDLFHHLQLNQIC